MNKTVIEAELPSELAAQARAFVAEGWATDLNELLVEALRYAGSWNPMKDR